MKRRYSSTVVGFPIQQHLRMMKHRQLNRKSLTGARAQVRATGDKECQFTETQPKLNR